MVKSGQAIVVIEPTVDATGALAAPSAGPVGTLYVNGVANAATVTVAGTNPYTFSVTLPALTAGDVVSLYATATISSIATGGKIWEDVADTVRMSEIAALTATAVWGAVTRTITGGAYNGTPPTASDIATAVWAAGTRTLSSFGTLVADAAAAVWAVAVRTITGGTVTTNSDKTGYALTSAYDPAKTAAQPGAGGDTLETLSGQLDTAQLALTALAGVGTTVNAYITKGTDGLPLPGATVYMRYTLTGAVYGPRVSDGLGKTYWLGTPGGDRYHYNYYPNLNWPDDPDHEVHV